MDNLTLNSPFSYQTNNVGDIKYFIQNNNNNFLNNKTNYNHQIYLIFIKTKKKKKKLFIYFLNIIEIFLIY